MATKRSDHAPEHLPVPASLPTLEAMESTRAVRSFKPDPVPSELLKRLIWAATRASNPNNVQGWAFVVVTDRSVRTEIARFIQAAFPIRSENELPTEPMYRRNAKDADRLIARIGEVPALIFVCGDNNYPPGDPIPQLTYSAVYAAAQNLMVAARSIGLGAAFTTLHGRVEQELRPLLNIPDHLMIAVTMPVGWPAREPGPVNRRPVSEVMHVNQFHD